MTPAGSGYDFPIGVPFGVLSERITRTSLEDIYVSTSQRNQRAPYRFDRAAVLMRSISSRRWLQAVENGKWDRPAEALPDAALWPTWGALRERILTNSVEVRAFPKFEGVPRTPPSTATSVGCKALTLQYRCAFSVSTMLRRAVGFITR